MSAHGESEAQVRGEYQMTMKINAFLIELFVKRHHNIYIYLKTVKTFMNEMLQIILAQNVHNF